MKRILLWLFLAIWFTSSVPAHAASTASRGTHKAALPDSKILFIFVDSLRPDVVDDMVDKGQLPTIKKLFYDQGLRFPNFFSTFPSLTITAFTCLITGKWQDQSGLKAQSVFERFPVRKKNIMKRMFFIPEHFPRYFNLLSRVDKPSFILKQNGIKAFYDYLGEKYHSSVVPVHPLIAPWAWPHVAANDVEHPYRVTIEAAERLDNVNGLYGLRYMVPDTRGKLFLLWFTEMDEDQHRYEWGQFSQEVRKKIEGVDKWIGKLHEAFMREDNGRAPYVVFFSDHGSYGGMGGIYNQPYYLDRDFFYKTLKMNVRSPDYVISHPGTDLSSFTFIDNMGRGQARIFLPVGDSNSGKWDRPNTLYELQHYGLGPNREPVNLIRELLNIDLSQRNKFPEKIDPHPVDFLIIKLSEELIYIAKRTGNDALIHIESTEGKLRYRYEPAHNVSQDAKGSLNYEAASADDPFGYLKHPHFHTPDPEKFIGEFHNDQEWLEATYETDYPDAISAIVHALMWKPEFAPMAKAQDPDIWLSATPGWNFRSEDIHGADHGSAYKDSLRSILMLSGPNIRSGIDPSPHRIIDVTPTLFQILDHSEKTDFDSEPIGGIFAN
ncbi:MAG TPA: alkaline phosphatase family protein [Candidatus Omnitrophota bacterium]|nr:alkaline phosphatase family protein [Candidatus Omnitrophota bacterium]